MGRSFRQGTSDPEGDISVMQSTGARRTRIGLFALFGVGLVVVATATAGAATGPKLYQHSKPHSPRSSATRAFDPVDPALARKVRGNRPNIVFVLTDDLSNDLLRYMPHVRALKRRG